MYVFNPEEGREDRNASILNKSSELPLLLVAHSVYPPSTDKIRFVFYVTKSNITLVIRVYDLNLHSRNDAVLNTINHAKNQRNIQYYEKKKDIEFRK